MAYRAARLTADGRRIGEDEPLHLAVRRRIGAASAEKPKKRQPSAPAKKPRTDRAPETGDPLFKSLRAWRSAKAKSKGVPAFCVFADSTLVDIVDTMPGSEEELLEIRGIGPRLLKEFGAEILGIVATSRATTAERPRAT